VGIGTPYAADAAACYLDRWNEEETYRSGEHGTDCTVYPWFPVEHVARYPSTMVSSFGSCNENKGGKENAKLVEAVRNASTDWVLRGTQVERISVSSTLKLDVLDPANGNG
jgi:hypothetical protein